MLAARLPYLMAKPGRERFFVLKDRRMTSVVIPRGASDARDFDDPSGVAKARSLRGLLLCSG